MRLLRILSPFALLLLAAPSRAEEPPAPDWNASFADAHESLVKGDFAECAAKMNALVATAPTEATKAIAAEDADLCRKWAAKGFVFVKKSDLGESSIAAKAQGIRTTDELAVLYTNAVLFGVGTGLWLDVYTEPNSAGGAIFPVLGFAGVAAAGVAIADGSSPFKYGVPQSIVTGMYVGLEEGITWSLWNQARSTRRDQWEAKTVASVIWGSAVAGALTGGIVGTARGTTPGRASYVGSAALWSGLVGGLLGAALSKDDYRADDNALLASAVALNAGALGGMLTASNVSPSIARVRFIDLGGIAGGLLFGGLYLAVADKNPGLQGFAGVTALGIATGLGVAYFATAGMTPDHAPGETAQKKETFVGSLAPGFAPAKGGGMATVSAVF
ncbi:MAG: hypothetical protein ACXVEE_26000 [Polyangiales bacterium]